MTWREQLIARILLLIARMVADDAIAQELKHLSTHIHVHAARQEASDADE